jgi:uncharacterized alkaline shock family protein YloU
VSLSDDLFEPGVVPEPEPEVTPEPEAAKPLERIGQNDLGRIEVSSRAVEKIAAFASLDVEDAGGTAGRLLGLAGRRRADVGRIPKVSADLDGGHVFLDVELSVRWPAPIAAVATAVRERLIGHVSTLVGLEVSEVNIQVVDLVTDAPAGRVS